MKTQELYQKLKVDNPYLTLNVDDYQLDLQGWNSFHENFYNMLEKYRPSLVVEVGSWKGGSAVSMAKAVKALELDCHIICVDTWLGSIEHRRSDEYKAWLNDKHGYPQIFYQFAANIMKQGLQDIVVPFPQHSLIAAQWFREQKIVPDLVYIDASHEVEPVFADVTEWYNTVAYNGALFGDDVYCPEVALALNLFTRVNGIAHSKVDAIQWLIKKDQNESAKRILEILLQSQ